jgi:nitrogen fixation NifU-like protein
MTDAGAETDRFYQQVIMRHSRTPAHAHRPARVDAEGHASNRLCGDAVAVFLERPGERLDDVGFQAEGCAISVAAADLMAEAVRGRRPAEVRGMARAFRAMIDRGEAWPHCPPGLRALAGVHAYKSRRVCATLPWQALEDALGAAETAR